MRFINGKLKVGVRGNHLSMNVGFYPGNTYRNGGSPFGKGNKFAEAKNMSPESHAARMQALYRGWATHVRKRHGEKVMTSKQRKKISKGHKRRIHLKIIRELSEIRDMARMSATVAMERMVKIVEDSTSRDADAISAAQVIFDRGYGKANQTTINANVDANGKQTEVSQQELDARINKALARVEGIAARAPKAPPSPQRPVDLRKLN